MEKADCVTFGCSLIIVLTLGCTNTRHSGGDAAPVDASLQDDALPVSSCQDGLDNDLDGYIDDEDTDCAGSDGTEEPGYTTPGVEATWHPAAQVSSWLFNVGMGAPVWVVPYFNYLVIFDFERRQENLDLIKPMLQWHLDHLNYDDYLGNSATIYDYQVYPDGSETAIWDPSGLAPLTECVIDPQTQQPVPRGSEIGCTFMDSVDSYSAFFLIALNDYFQRAGDLSFVETNKSIIFDVADSIAHIQDSDGLTWCKEDYKVKYLMDACEAYGGLDAFNTLGTACGWSNLEYYRDIRDSLADGIWSLYNASTGLFATDKDEAGSRTEGNWDVYYPGAYAQLAVVYFDIPTVSSTIKESLFQEFRQRYRFNVIEVDNPERSLYYRLIEARAVLELGYGKTDKERIRSQSMTTEALAEFSAHNTL